MSNQTPKSRIYLENGKPIERIVPSLAKEIGLNESIMLLQIDHWIGISDHFLAGHWWTYQSIREMQEKAFPYWSIATINRTAINLEEKGYIITGNFNERKGDRTRWFRFSNEGMKALALQVPEIQYLVPNAQPIETPMKQDGNSLFQNETPSPQVIQNETPMFQNETTLPEITTDTKDTAPNVADASEVKKSKRTAKPKADSDVDQAQLSAIIKAWVDKLPAPPAFPAYQNKGIRSAAAGMVRAGVLPDDVTAYMTAKYKDSFWTGMYMKITFVAENLPSWKAANVSRTSTEDMGSLDGILKLVKLS